MGHPRLDGTTAQVRPLTWCHPDKPYRARGMCVNCYQRWKRSFDPPELRRASDRKSGLKQALALAEITHEQYEQVLQSQGGVCAICARGPVGKTRLSLDHDHTTNKFRGLLCDPCNRAIGYLNDNPERARHLAAYLDKFAQLYHGREFGGQTWKA